MRPRSDLRVYQNENVNLIKSTPYSGLWTKMGGGKTVSALTAVSDLSDDLEAIRTLVIAPLRVADTVWHREAAKWEHLQHLKFHRLELPNKVMRKKTETDIQYKARQIAKKTEYNQFVLDTLNIDADIFLANVEQLEHLVFLFKSRWPFETIILDESSLFGSHKSKRWRALKKVNRLIRRMTQLTGTAAGNGLQKVWTQVYLLDKGQRLCRKWTSFKDKYFDENKYTHALTAKEGSREEIVNRISDIVHVVDEYDGLPSINENTVTIPHTPKPLTDYEELQREYILELQEGDIEASNSGVLWNKLMQISNGAVLDAEKNVHHVHDCKLKALKEIVDDMGESVIIVYRNIHDKARIKKFIKHAVEVDKKGVAFDRWERGEIDVLLMHPKSGGHGLEGLQMGGRNLIWFGATKDLDLYDQMNARLRRSGQGKTVFVTRLISEGTMEDRVLGDLEEREDFHTKFYEEIINRRKSLTINM